MTDVAHHRFGMCLDNIFVLTLWLLLITKQEFQKVKILLPGEFIEYFPISWIVLFPWRRSYTQNKELVNLWWMSKYQSTFLLHALTTIGDLVPKFRQLCVTLWNLLWNLMDFVDPFIGINEKKPYQYQHFRSKSQELYEMNTTELVHYVKNGGKIEKPCRDSQKTEWNEKIKQITEQNIIQMKTCC